MVARGFMLLVEGWRQEAKVIVYCHREVDAQAVAHLREQLSSALWVKGVQVVSPEEANDRFRATFPSLETVLEGWGENPLPASLEVEIDPLRANGPAFEDWLRATRALSAVAMVDDDREWLQQLERAIRLLRAVGLGLGAILTCAAIFTISSVIRLTAYLYRDEIAVMRLVGATEFFIRGPFYTEGLLQGALGGGIALLFLGAAQHLAISELRQTVSLGIAEWTFLPWQQQLALWAMGVAAGLIGAVVSLRRETFGET